MSAAIIQFRPKAATNSDVAIKPATHQPDEGVSSQDLAAGAVETGMSVSASTPAASFGDDLDTQLELVAVEMARD